MSKDYIDGESKEQRKARKLEEKAVKESATYYNDPSIKYYVLCLKHGTKYSSDYVNRLYNMVKRHCTLDYEFVCLTENPTGINSNIKTIPLPPGLKGWWCKPYMYSADLPIKGTVLYMDLDVVIANNINKLFTWEPDHWCTIRDFTRVMRPQWQKYNSSVVRFKTGQLDHVWKDFSNNPTAVQGKFFGDQDHLFESTKNTPAMMYPDDWIRSWKWEIRKNKQLGRGARGERKLLTIENVVPKLDCCVCVFHGDPNPEHCEDPWVVDNWR